MKLNGHKWDYSKVDDVCYSDSVCESYKKARVFLGDTVEDWGGGTGWARRYFKSYRNVDFSKHDRVDQIADLTSYTSSVGCILIRQVLDASPEWKKILENAKKSFNEKLCVVIGTPLVKKTRLGVREPVYDANGNKIENEYYQEMLFNKKDILDMFSTDQYKRSEETIKTKQYYHEEWILYIEKIA